MLGQYISLRSTRGELLFLPGHRERVLFVSFTIIHQTVCLMRVTSVISWCRLTIFQKTLPLLGSTYINKSHHLTLNHQNHSGVDTKCVVTMHHPSIQSRVIATIEEEDIPPFNKSHLHLIFFPWSPHSIFHGLVSVLSHITRQFRFCDHGLAEQSGQYLATSIWRWLSQ